MLSGGGGGGSLHRVRGHDTDLSGLAAVARAQHGLVTRRQILHAGLTGHRIGRLVELGHLEPMHTGVYRMAGTPGSGCQLLLGACLAAGDRSVISHRAAAWLWDLVGGRLEVVELTVPSNCNPRLPGTVVHRAPVTGRRPASTVRGIPVTDPLWTLAELGAVADGNTLEQAVDAAIARRLLTVGALRAELNRRGGRGHRGVGPLRAILDRRDPVGSMAPSVLESRMQRVLRHLERLGAPKPVREMVIGRRFRLDFAYPRARLGIEVDGWAGHSTFDAFQGDRARQNTLVIADWRILRYTWTDISRDREHVVTEIARALGLKPPPALHRS